MNSEARTWRHALAKLPHTPHGQGIAGARDVFGVVFGLVFSGLLRPSYSSLASLDSCEGIVGSWLPIPISLAPNIAYYGGRGVERYGVEIDCADRRPGGRWRG